MAGTLNISDLSTLDQAVVQQNQALLAQLLQQLRPTIDTKRGTLYDYVLYLSAVLGTAAQAQVDAVRQANSLLAINTHPSLATPDVVDRLLSNYGLARRIGTVASGPIQIVLSQAAVITVPKGASFTANGMIFTTATAFTSRITAETVLSSTDRLLVAASNGTYTFTIMVQAQAVGVAGNISQGTRLTLPVTLSPYFLQAVAVADFAGGTNTESNAALMTRMTQGLGFQAWANRMTADVLLRNQPAFTNILGESIIGYGDAEMIRDQHSVWPGSFGGRVDMYVRTQALAATTVLSKSATLVQVNSGGFGVWQFVLGRDEVPAFFEVSKIAQDGLLNQAASGYAIVSDVRSLDMTNLTGHVPDVTNADEANFSAYSTGTIQFTDTDTVTTGLTIGVSTRTYDVAVRYMPLIADIQDFIRDRGVIAPAGDILVKAPIPLFVTISFTLHLLPGALAPDTATVQQAVADKVNTLGFGNKLSASAVAAAVSPLLPAGSVITDLEMNGRLRYTDNTVLLLNSTTVLVPPEDATQPMTTLRTIGYFVSPTDVQVSIVTIDTPQV